MLRLLIITLFTIPFIISCKDTGKTKDVPQVKESEKEKLYTLALPRNGETFTNKDSILIKIESKDNMESDSCILFIDGNRVGLSETNTYNLNPKDLKMGVRRFALHIFTKGEKEILPFALKIKPKGSPKVYTYKVIKEYPHDVKAYTQGLFYKDGFLYESTGEYGRSSLRKVELSTGKVIKKLDLDASLFGEGACLYNDKIYQLTWKNKKGFIYNLDFEQESTFTYSSEGWGLESDGENLWMVDGTSILSRLNPKDMSIVEQIEVHTDKGQVSYLNELEFINGEIWANVYTEDYLVTINPKTGEVTSIIDLTNILDRRLYTSSTDVLNGIAYDKVNDRIFVTGKNWPKLFEIKLVAK